MWRDSTGAKLGSGPVEEIQVFSREIWDGMGGWVCPYHKVDKVCLTNVHTLEIIESTDSSGNGSTGLCGYVLKTFHSG